MAEQKLYNAIDIKRSASYVVKKFDARAKPIVLITLIKNVAK